MAPVHRVDVPRRAEVVPQPERAGVLLSRWPVPGAIARLLAPCGAPCSQAEEIVLGLAFDPAGCLATPPEKIGGVPHAQSPPVLCLGLQPQPWLGLIIELQTIRIVLLLEHSGEFVGVALELDGHAHLATRVATSHVLAASTHAARWRCSTDLVEKFLCLLREPETSTPRHVLLVGEHPVPSSVAKPTAGVAPNIVQQKYFVHAYDSKQHAMHTYASSLNDSEGQHVVKTYRFTANVCFQSCKPMGKVTAKVCVNRTGENSADMQQ